MIKYEKPFVNKTIESMGFTNLTDVQKKVIPLLKDRRDLIVSANTGSGKTHAFLIPIFEALRVEEQLVQAVIIAPTRELAVQIYEFAMTFTKNTEAEINIDLFIGGIDRDNILAKLERRMPHIAIGTPGRIHDLAVKENVLKVYTCDYFVVDEADMTLENNFLDEVSNILALIQENTTKAVFSATIPQSLKPFLKKYLNNPVIIDVHPHDVSSLNIEHFFVKTRERDRFLILDKVIKAINPYLAVVFCNTKESAILVYDWMKNKDMKVTLIHGGIDYRKRKQLMRRINSLEFEYIVATDIFSRGIDVEGISHIINYELPRNIEFYIHRTGRTGRVDFDGIAISLYEFNDNSYLDRLEKKGIRSVYKEIKNNQLVDGRERAERHKREWKENELDYAAKRLVRKPKQVKPGYKKKYQSEVDRMKKKIAKKRK